MPLLEVASIAAGYGGRQILWDLSLLAQAGQVTCLLGPNGSGKTTLARVVAGSLRAATGCLRFDGRDIGRWTPEARARAGIAHVPQGRRVFPDLTVAENLRVARFAARARRDPATAELVFELFPPLRHLLRHPAGSLSGGEQQMLAVGRALMTEPRLLILDEPSLGLSPLLVENLYEAIGRIRRQGIAMLLIEQMVGPALAVADWVAMLEMGRIVQSGPAAGFEGAAALTRSYLGAGPGTAP